MAFLPLALFAFLTAPVQVQVPLDPNDRVGDASSQTRSVLRIDWSEFSTVGTTSGPWKRTESAAQVTLLEPVFRRDADEPRWMEAVGDLAPKRNVVDRDALEGAIEGFQPYREVPGGIVLGLTAKVTPELGLPEPSSAAERFENARFRSDHFGWWIEVEGGSAYRFPEMGAGIDRQALSELIAFVSSPSGSDGLIDLVNQVVAWRAPEIESASLQKLLIEVDQAPRQTLNISPHHKSVIVDRGVRIIPNENEKTLRVVADLEVRFYARGDSAYVRDVLRRVEAFAFADTRNGMRALSPLPVGARGKKLVRALERLVPLARWIGFLRWLREADPTGFQRLRVEASEDRSSALQGTAVFVPVALTGE